jgi:spore coat polysaccharide biosynthesis protein SpsF|tara:strand:+ start:465 stop:1217 length:753 start_codon:yes stop_codon:yes gene_type:complete
MQKNKSTPHIICVLPCRIFSTRLFAKPLQQINNYEILLLLISQLRKSTLLNEIVLAISDDSGSNLYIDFAKKLQIPYVLGSECDVLSRLIKGVKKENGDILFRVTSENPYIYWEGIDNLIKNHLSGNYDLSFYKNLPIGASYEVINLKSLEIAHRLGNTKHRSEYSSLYFFENQDDFSINPVLPKKSLQFPKIRLTVDTPEDLIVARIIHDKLGTKTNPIKLEKIINFLNLNKKIQKLNSKIELKYTRYL